MKINGKLASWEAVIDAIGRPRIRLVMPNTGELELTLNWRGAAITPSEDDGPLVRRQQGQFEWLAPSGSAPTEAPEFLLTNQRQPEGKQETVDLAPFFNDRLVSIFRKGKYLAPRVKATLSLPSQGIGAWAGHVNELPLIIDDAGLRAAAGPDGVFRLPDHGQFALPGSREGVRAMFVSNWSNYPVERAVPLTGRARYLRLLMAGTTNPMQSRIDNGEVVIAYADREFCTPAALQPDELVAHRKGLPDRRLPVRAPGERPLRVDLKTGRVRMPAGVEERPEGGSATVLGIALDPAGAPVGDDSRPGAGCCDRDAHRRSRGDACRALLVDRLSWRPPCEHAN